MRLVKFRSESRLFTRGAGARPGVFGGEKPGRKGARHCNMLLSAGEGDLALPRETPKMAASPGASANGLELGVSSGAESALLGGVATAEAEDSVVAGETVEGAGETPVVGVFSRGARSISRSSWREVVSAASTDSEEGEKAT